MTRLEFSERITLAYRLGYQDAKRDATTKEANKDVKLPAQR